MEYPNWFNQTGLYYFNKLLNEFKGKPNLKFLQIGVFTGDASVWLCENILTDTSSTLIDVDTWLGSNEDTHEKMDFVDVERVYDEKVKSFTNIVKVKMNSRLYLNTDEEDIFDFVYVDGAHTADNVFMDGIQSWKKLKVGGIMAFDDYLWGKGSNPVLTPKMGIDLFLTIMRKQINILGHGAQIWLKKVGT